MHIDRRTFAAGLVAVLAGFYDLPDTDSDGRNAVRVPPDAHFEFEPAEATSKSAQEVWQDRAAGALERKASDLRERGLVVSAAGWVKPVTNGRFTSGFGSRMHPVLGVRVPHNGVDLAAPVSTPIHAIADGTVIRAGGTAGHTMDPDYEVSGYLVAIDHGAGLVSTYNHLVHPDQVRASQSVAAGDQIGQVGMSGMTTGPHLHFQILNGPGSFIDPETFMADRGIDLRGS